MDPKVVISGVEEFANIGQPAPSEIKSLTPEQIRAALESAGDFSDSIDFQTPFVAENQRIEGEQEQLVSSGLSTKSPSVQMSDEENPLEGEDKEDNEKRGEHSVTRPKVSEEVYYESDLPDLILMLSSQGHYMGRDDIECLSSFLKATAGSTLSGLQGLLFGRHAQRDHSVISMGRIIDDLSSVVENLKVQNRSLTSQTTVMKDQMLSMISAIPSKGEEHKAKESNIPERTGTEKRKTKQKPRQNIQEVRNPVIAYPHGEPIDEQISQIKGYDQFSRDVSLVNYGYVPHIFLDVYNISEVDYQIATRGMPHSVEGIRKEFATDEEAREKLEEIIAKFMDA
ncbi:TPA_asm: protein 2 [Torreya virus 1]|uniref:Protein 2 n=1 Tax=Torreya virus 1 TaxID=2977995 RepID=A0A9N6YJL1_9RHAB|nr:TPA_asm: protein 2 [Torreya virus 1]